MAVGNKEKKSTSKITKKKKSKLNAKYVMDTLENLSWDMGKKVVKERKEIYDR